jgi:hypothetical protein
MTVLLDGNLLIALLVDDHVHHRSAEQWWTRRVDPGFATTPTTQATLLRFLVRNGMHARDSVGVLERFIERTEHELWPDDVAYNAAIVRGVVGHRQVTDAYLAAQARRHAGVLATFDAGLAATHGDVAELVPIVARDTGDES